LSLIATVIHPIKHLLNSVVAGVVIPLHTRTQPPQIIIFDSADIRFILNIMTDVYHNQNPKSMALVIVGFDDNHRHSGSTSTSARQIRVVQQLVQSPQVILSDLLQSVVADDFVRMLRQVTGASSIR
jgi:hypothetical protein